MTLVILARCSGYAPALCIVCHTPEGPGSWPSGFRIGNSSDSVARTSALVSRGVHSVSYCRGHNCRTLRISWRPPQCGIKTDSICPSSTSNTTTSAPRWVTRSSSKCRPNSGIPNPGPKCCGPPIVAAPANLPTAAQIRRDLVRCSSYASSVGVFSGGLNIYAGLSMAITAATASSRTPPSSIKIGACGSSAYGGTSRIDCFIAPNYVTTSALRQACYCHFSTNIL